MKKILKNLLTNFSNYGIINTERDKDSLKNQKGIDTMTNSNKMTNRVALTYALEHLPDAPADVRDKWQKMIEQLDKKNASPKKLTAQQEKNETVKADLVEFLADHEGTGFTVSDLLKSVPAVEGDSNQHVSALMRALVLAGTVEKYTEKRRTYFRIATGE